MFRDKRQLREHLLISLWAIALLFGSFQTVFANFAPESGTVYCPLQKRWVPSAQAKPVVTISSTDYCASPSTTREFSQKLAASPIARLVSSQDQVDELFFAYTSVGSRAFVDLRGSPNAPSPKFAVQRERQTSGANFADTTPALLPLEAFQSGQTLANVGNSLPQHNGPTISTADRLTEPQRGPPSN
ncbi:MAG TPA: hypothetical protein PKA82_02515 [Pyrinomonadaceae bacterium]|nr:hypothetical protein [Pyrinomonadaceae bacterium]